MGEHKNCKLTPEQRDEIAKRYIGGEGSTSLSREYGVSTTNVLNLVRHRGAEVRGGSKLTRKQWNEIAARYESGENTTKLAKEFKIKNVTVIEIARKFHIPIRDNWESRGRYSLNHDAFSNPTPETLYWAGFLMADGNINDKKNSVSLSLASKDIAHIEKFKKFVGAQHKITKILPQKMKNGYMSSGAYSITFVSRKIISDLARWGITPRKSHTAKIIGGIEGSKDFFRGVVDGDGTIGTHKVGRNEYPHISLIGSEHIVNQFSDFVKKISPECSVKIRKGIGVFIFATHGRFALKTIEFLYKDSCVSLDRKYERAIKFINQGQTG